MDYSLLLVIEQIVEKEKPNTSTLLNTKPEIIFGSPKSINEELRYESVRSVRNQFQSVTTSTVSPRMSR